MQVIWFGRTVENSTDLGLLHSNGNEGIAMDIFPLPSTNRWSWTCSEARHWPLAEHFWFGGEVFSLFTVLVTVLASSRRWLNCVEGAWVFLTSVLLQLMKAFPEVSEKKCPPQHYTCSLPRNNLGILLQEVEMPVFLRGVEGIDHCCSHVTCGFIYHISPDHMACTKVSPLSAPGLVAVSE